MKTCYRSLKSLLFMLVLCMVGTLSAWADSYTYKAKTSDFKKADSFSFKDGDVTWNATSSNWDQGSVSSQQSGGVQLVQLGSGRTSKNFAFTLSTSSIKGNITSIVVETCLSGSGAKFSLTTSVGGTQIGKGTITENTIKEFTFTPTSSAEGEVVINWKNVGNKSTGIRIKSITINYTSSSEPIDPTAVAAPIFSESSKSFSDKFKLTLTKGNNAEKILYTTDGTEPSNKLSNGEIYTAPINIAHTTTVKAIAVSNEGKESKVVTNEYKLELPAPVLSVSSKDFSEAFDVEISTPATAAEGILYTLDGSTPSFENNSTDIYTKAINISATTTLKAVSYTSNGDNYEYSEVVTNEYKLKLPAPVLSVSSKKFSETFDVEISTPATAAEGILYTLDGSTPSWDNNSTNIYTDAIKISATTTLKAVSYASNGSNYEYSPVATATYTWVDPSVIWSEDFSGFKKGAVPTKGENATYKCTGKTKVYTDHLAGGDAPELLISKDGKSFTATIIDLKGAKNGMILTFLDNKGNLNVSATNATILSKDVTKIDEDHFTSTYIFALVDPSAEVSISMKSTTSDNVRIDNIELSKYEKISSFNITEAGYATYYTSDAYAMPKGVTGYTITANNGSELTMKEAYTEGETVPAQTALVLKGEAGKYSFLPTTSTEITPADNKLHGSDVAAETHVDGTNVKYYKLSYDSKGANLGFYWGAENGAAFTNGAHKAYLALDGTTLLSQKQGFSFADLMNGLTTSINQANAANAAKQSIFDINGRRVNSWNGAAKGIYIVNGQKVLVK